MTPTPAAPAARAEYGELAQRLPVFAVVLLFLFFAWAHATVTPLARRGSFINAPDERAHVRYVEALAVGHRLPLRHDTQFETYQWHQPPLYYVLVSVAYPLGLRAMRAVSVLLGIITLWAIWSAANVVLTRRPLAVLFAVAFAALLPMRQAVLAAVGNDAAIECVFSLALYVMVLLLARGWNARLAVVLGVLLAAALLTKSSGLLLVLPVMLAVWLAARSLRPAKRIAWTVAPVALAAVLSSPWYVRNARLYGEVLPIRAFHAEFAGTSRARDWIGKQPLSVDPWTGDLHPDRIMDARAYAALVANWTVRTFFAAYTPPAKEAVGAPVFLPPSAYAVWLALILLGFVGALGSVRSPGIIRVVAPLGLATVLVLVSFVGFASTYFQAQGRYLYPAVLPLAVAWGSGMDRLVPRSHAWQAAALILAVLALLSAAFVFLYVAPAYQGTYR